MSEAEAVAAIAALPDGVYEAVDALLEFGRVTHDKNLSIGDLADGLRLATTAECHTTLVIAFNMALLAVELADKAGAADGR